MHFSMEGIPPDRRLAAFRQGAPTHQIDLADGAEEGDLQAEVDIWTIGRLMVVHSRYSPTRWVRSEAHIQADRLDHLQINLTLSGTGIIEVDGVEHLLRPGSVLIVDYQYPVRSHAKEPLEHVTLTIPRSDFSRDIAHPDGMHGHILNGTTSLVLADHFRSLVRHLSNASAAEADRLAKATTAILAACLVLPEGVRRISAGKTTIDDIRRFIDEHAASPDCDAQMVLRAFNLSRPTLYRLARPIGGVAAYILRRRLEVAASMIRNTSSPLSIAQISHACGFQSPAHFSRLYQKRFGHPPSRARTLPEATGAAGSEAAQTAYVKLTRSAGGEPDKLQ